MKIAIDYKDVGRNKFSGIINYDLRGGSLSANDVASLAYTEARKHSVPAGIRTTYDPETNSGVIYAGFHNAGNFRLVEGKVNLEIIARLRKEE